ncbi:GGDEF domain-containing protein [Aeromonas sobria]|uniref:diguanylate cyclase n=1 Tax=Aeromonas sobria TaxID=646 RepID=A0A1S2CZN8_AERSO|nr:GGDEF domain-containing protein [Aeromonas sobria]MBS4686665.1 GGDEF domain-containing protein [Aeromonas sobria]OHY93223.1 diguanylate cyclase [Aeromonas sobria]
MNRRTFRLGPALIIILFTVALLPALLASTVLLIRQHQIIAQSEQSQLERALTSMTREARFRSELTGTQINQLSQDRVLHQALDNFLFSSHARLALATFIKSNSLLTSAYLINDQGQVVEYIHGQASHLEASNLMPQLMAWSKTREAKQGKHLLLPVDDPVLVGNMEQEHSGGLALVAPIYRNHQRAGVMQTPSGFVMAILPWRQMAHLLEPYLKGSEYLVISQGASRLYQGIHHGDKAVDDRAPSQMAQPLVISWPQLEKDLTPTITLYSYNADRVSELNKSQQLLTGSIVVMLLLVVISCVWLTRWLTRPLRSLAELVRSYGKGNYQQRQAPLRFVEYDEVRQLLQEMAYTISAQVRALYQQNQQLQLANSEKETFNQRLVGFNDELEQEVAAQTTALRLALSREARSRHILQSWLQFGLHQQLDLDIAELASSALLQISELYPGHSWGLVIRQDGQECYALTQGVDIAMRGIFQEKLAQLMDEDAKYSECLWQQERWKIMTLPGSQSGVRFGYLMVSAEGLETEDRAILRLFVKQLAVGIEGRLFTDELARVARTDNLTGLPNRQAFEETFQHYQAVLARHPERHLALFMLDLNGLKRTNDQYGHEAGDALLNHMAQQLRTLCRQDEQIFRIGGDEFVLLAEADHLACQQLAARLEASQQSTTVQHGEHSFPLRFAIGWSSSDQTPLTELSRVADEAMYADKARFYHGQP